MEKIIKTIAQELKLSINHVKNVITLIDEGNTLPFIARYRKEMTGSIDDQVLRELSERLVYLRNLETRKSEIISVISEQEKLTDEIKNDINSANTLAELEDIYRPFRPKRRTRASVAREKGLEPLATILLEQSRGTDLADYAEDDLAGARDIIAEIISDDVDIRKNLKDLFRRTALVASVATNKEEESVYKMYYDFSESLGKMQSHRILAVNRGEKEGFLKATLKIDKNTATGKIVKEYVKNNGLCSEQVRMAAEDSYDRLIEPSVEREIRNELTETANIQAIKTFALNLKALLMQAPVKNKVTMGFDPAYRTGCKIAVVDGTGKLLDQAVIYPTKPHNDTVNAEKKMRELIEKHGIKVISIGNGTASRESEIFVANLIKGSSVEYMVVSEAGASVYSASKLAASEFPDLDVSLRSAVSIARRLQDPLAELVKIDPKSIGIGQYQHDMPPAQLDESLIGVVEDCVNAVGVDLNTASPQLLSRVSGISANIAKNIVSFREENGKFAERKQLLKVPKLGPKSYEQCAGFLRVSDGKNILDNTGVHPESYPATLKLIEHFGKTIDDIKNGNLEGVRGKISEESEARVAEYCGVGVPTLRDIVEELSKPGRDPRDELPPPMLRSDVMSVEDLKPGMEIKGTVRNVVDFGAFVDIGVHQDGLVHISKLANRFVKHPSEIVKTGDTVTVYVVEIDSSKKRISLSMISE